MVRDEIINAALLLPSPDICLTILVLLYQAPFALAAFRFVLACMVHRANFLWRALAALPELAGAGGRRPEVVECTAGNGLIVER